MKKNQNQLKKGLVSKRKLEKSFYDFLFNKHFDWAIILASFFGCLPYFASDNYWLLAIKGFLFLMIIFISIRYIFAWKEISEVEANVNKAIMSGRKLIQEGGIKKKDWDEIAEFFDSLTGEFKTIQKMFIEQGSDVKAKSLGSFINENPDKFEGLLSLLNTNPTITKTSVGLGMVSLISLLELRHLPHYKYRNYKRIGFLVILVSLFFIVYGVEIVAKKTY